MPRAASALAINRAQDDKVDGPIGELALAVGGLAQTVLEQVRPLAYIKSPNPRCCRDIGLLIRGENMKVCKVIATSLALGVAFTAWASVVRAEDDESKAQLRKEKPTMICTLSMNI